MQIEHRVILHRFGGNIHATREIKLSAEDWNVLKI